MNLKFLIKLLTKKIAINIVVKLIHIYCYQKMIAAAAKDCANCDDLAVRVCRSRRSCIIYGNFKTSQSSNFRICIRRPRVSAGAQSGGVGGGGDGFNTSIASSLRGETFNVFLKLDNSFSHF